MPSIDFGLSSYERAEGNLPELPVINMYAEEAPTEEKGVVLQSRPPLEDREQDMGTGPVDCLFKRDLVLDSALFGVSAGKLYEGTTLIGNLGGPGPFSIAGYKTNLFATGGAGLWGYDGSTLAGITFPDGQSVVKVIVAASRLVAIAAETGQFYWSDSLETDIEGLDFATAENQPDRLLDMLFIDDILMLFGAETVEFWPNTQSADLPFQPLEGRVIEKGIRATGCATAIGPTFAWVTNDNQVCLSDENTVLSNAGLEAKIAASETVRLFTFLIGSVEFLGLRMDDEFQAWGWSAKLWHEFTSYDEVNFIPQCFAGGVFGSAIDGRTLAFGTAHYDLGGTFERRFRAGLYGGAGLTIRNLLLYCNVGQAPELEGDYAAPEAEMRYSLDNGQTWTDWQSISLGAQGEYWVTPEWRSLGMLKRGKGFLVEFRVTDPVPFRVSDVKINEPMGGR